MDLKNVGRILRPREVLTGVVCIVVMPNYYYFYCWCCCCCCLLLLLLLLLHYYCSSSYYNNNNLYIPTAVSLPSSPPSPSPVPHLLLLCFSLEKGWPFTFFIMDICVFMYLCGYVQVRVGAYGGQSHWMF